MLSCEWTTKKNGFDCMYCADAEAMKADTAARPVIVNFMLDGKIDLGGLEFSVDQEDVVCLVCESSILQAQLEALIPFN